ncbi:hypothetical protein F5Y18DRAFT_425174 [Xylariaceae sp. FL1019]|nr:hypothetical protein F5Y18DRAFT_425174 [Xylariaceae sp. FL1019]
MDPGTVAGLTAKALLICGRFLLAVLNAKDEMEKIRFPLLTFQAAVNDLEQAIQMSIDNGIDSVSIVKPLTQRGGVLDQSAQHIREIIRLLGGDEDLDDSAPEKQLSLRQKFSRLSLDDVKWPMKRRQIGGLLEKIEECRGVIYGAFPNLTAHMVPKVLVQLNDFETKMITKWLCPTGDEIRTMHTEKTSLQEADTCTWLLQEPQWKSWLHQGKASTTNVKKFIWIYGIPGAGKTVMASFIIERIAHVCRSRGFAYYYCLHSRKQDETVPFLQWTLRQLCRQAGSVIPNKIHEAYRADQGLGTKDLLCALKEISQHFRTVYIVVDAVDESSPRENLMSTLIEIGTGTGFDNVSLLFTSRHEPDIVSYIDPAKSECSEISMSNPNVSADIKRYIRKQLDGPNWRRWREDFLIEIENRIAHEAKGMFRYAVCQLDVLKRLSNEESIRDALSCLPKDLFATYERILDSIPAADRIFARTALALICSDTAKVPSAEILVKACLHDHPLSVMTHFTVESLQQICGCLITLSALRNPPQTIFNRDRDLPVQFHRVRLAHYSVKEYLWFSGTAQGPAKFFALSDDDVRNLDLTVVFNGLGHCGCLRDQAEDARMKMTRYEEYCLSMTEKAITEHDRETRRSDIVNNEKLRDIVLRTLAPDHQHFKFLSRAHGMVTVMKNSFPNWNKLLVWEQWPAAKSTGIIANLVLLKWLELAQRYLSTDTFTTMSHSEKKLTWTALFKFREKTRLRNLLTICLEEKEVSFLRVFIRHGATFEDETEALYVVMRHFYKEDENGIDVHQNLRMLLDACASPNPTPAKKANRQDTSGQDSDRRIKTTGFIFTPLQYAVYNLEQDWVETLLEEGAEPNMIGTFGGVVPFAFDEDPQLDSNDIAVLQKVGQQTCLQICASTKPAWGRTANYAIKGARQGIKNLLLKHGAIDFEEDEDGTLVDESEAGADTLPSSTTGHASDLMAVDSHRLGVQGVDDSGVVFVGVRSIHGTPPSRSRSPANGSARRSGFRA